MNQPRTAIVTGGGVNLGKAISLRLAAEGCNVVIAGIETDEAQRTCAQIELQGGRSSAFFVDVTDESMISDMTAQVAEEYGAIDVLVNNAGIIGPTAPVSEINRADWEQTLDVNLTGAFLCAKAVLPAMIERRSGRIINISSIAGKIAYPWRSPYAVSKWGLIGLTLTLAKEVGEHNIQVNAICPGPVKGRRMKRVINDKARETGKSVEQVEQEYLQKMALGRMVTEEEVAGLVAYLISDAAHGMTGQAIEFAAGWGL